VISISDNIDAKSLIKHLNFLAFNRQASTSGEKKAINYIQNELAERNIQNKTEPFEWSKRSVEKLTFLGFACYIILYEILLILLNSRWLYIALFIILTSLFIITSVISFNFSHIIHVGKKRESRNVIAEISAQNERFKGPVVIFSTQHDSFSEKPYIRLQSFLYIFSAFLSLMYFLIKLILASWSFLYTLQGLLFEYARIVSLFVGVVIVGLLIFTIYIKNIKETTYNASGVASLIELAKILKSEPLNNINVVLLWCGAENLGLWGAKQYCAKNFFTLYKKYELEDSFLINIANIGHYIGLVKKTGLVSREKLSEKLNDVLEASANNLKVSVKKVINPSWARANYMIFRSHAKKAEKNLQISCFTTFGRPKSFQSTSTLPINIRVENISNCVNICYNAIKSLDLRVE